MIVYVIISIVINTKEARRARENHIRDLEYQIKLINLVRVLNEYKEFLEKQYNEAMNIASIHHYDCTEENIQKGIQLREKIKELELKIFDNEQSSNWFSIWWWR